MFLSMRPARSSSSSSSSILDDDDARETRPKAPASARAAAPLHVEDVDSASSTYASPFPSSATTHFSQSVIAAQSPRGEAPALARRQRVVALAILHVNCASRKTASHTNESSSPSTVSDRARKSAS